MEVTLIDYPNIHVVIDAIRTCWNSNDQSDSDFSDYRNPIVGEKDRKLIRKIVGFRHLSTTEHCHFNFKIKGISRACLQDFVRHRIANLSVKSSRFTLKKMLKNEIDFDKILVSSGSKHYDETVVKPNLQRVINYMTEHPDCPNDILKYGVPEALKTDLNWTINIRSLSNFLKLRTSKRALAEIRQLAFKVHEKLPDEYKIFFEDLIDA